MLNGRLVFLPVKCIDTLPTGVAGLPVGLPGLNGISLPLSAKIKTKNEGKK